MKKPKELEGLTQAIFIDAEVLEVTTKAVNTKRGDQLTVLSTLVRCGGGTFAITGFGDSATNFYNTVYVGDIVTILATLNGRETKAHEKTFYNVELILSKFSNLATKKRGIAEIEDTDEDEQPF